LLLPLFARYEQSGLEVPNQDALIAEQTLTTVLSKLARMLMVHCKPLKEFPSQRKAAGIRGSIIPACHPTGQRCRVVRQASTLLALTPVNTYNQSLQP
jgi:hypothetical protein